VEAISEARAIDGPCYEVVVISQERASLIRLL
jgi:hypothetical protein